MNRFLIFVLIFLPLFSCSDNKGNRIEATNLTLFFDDKSDFNDAKKIALFWKEKDLIGSKHQFLKLSRKNPKILYLHLIHSDLNKAKNINIKELNLLLDLQRQLDNLLVPKKINILVCDSSFKPIFNINN